MRRMDWQQLQRAPARPGSEPSGRGEGRPPRASASISELEQIRSIGWRHVKESPSKSRRHGGSSESCVRA